MQRQEIDLRLVFARLWSKRLWLAGSIVLFGAAFAAAAFLLTPKYRAIAVLVSAGTGQPASSLMGALGGLDTLASAAGLNLGATDARIQEALAVLQSRELTERFIQDRQLMPVLFYQRWDPVHARWKGRTPTLAQVFKFFDQHVRTVTRDKQTGLITLAIVWRDPDQAASWANDLIARLNAEMRARTIARVTASIDYLQKELATTSEIDTRRAMDQVMETQINERMLATVTEDYALRVVDRALPPDPKDIYSPNRPLLLIFGPVAGLLIGAVVVLLAGSFAASRPT
jgi:uncharacterized protein involved in exopolysaccharide biosynthesis